MVPVVFERAESIDLQRKTFIVESRELVSYAISCGPSSQIVLKPGCDCVEL